jgi:hypothetical protein
VEGFGRLWRKTYRVALTGSTASPSDVIRAWKEHFSEFWPDGNEFRARRGIRPGQVALVDISLGPAELSSGVLVVDSRETSFTLMTPKGHFFTGLITFTAYTEAAHTVAQAEVLMRAADPFYELGLTLGGHIRENWFWKQTLARLAHHFGVTEPEIEQHAVCVDKHRQWSRAGNLRHNKPIRATLQKASAPFRWAAARTRPLARSRRRR